MRHLRSKLFLSVGTILFVVALLNYFLPAIFVRKELNKASLEIDKHLNEVQDRIARFTSFLITYRIVETAAEMDGVITMISGDEILRQDLASRGSAWKVTGKIAAFNPEMAFVQMTDEAGHSYAVITSDQAPLYAPLWAPLEQNNQGMLWVKIPNQEDVFVAIPKDELGHYVLFHAKELDRYTLSHKSMRNQLAAAAAALRKNPQIVYQAFPQEAPTLSMDDSVETLYNVLLADEGAWAEKMDLIEQLLPYQEQEGYPPAGALKVDQNFSRGHCVLTDEVFIREELIKNMTSLPPDNKPFLILTKGKHGTSLEIARSVSVLNGTKSWIGIGFSISSMIRKLAQIAKRPVVIYKSGFFSLGYNQMGEEFEFDQDLLKRGQETLSWKGVDYVTRPIDLGQFQLMMLTPKEQATAFSKFLTHLRETISEEISLSLLSAALISLLVALALLSRISKTITQPIVQLSTASEELGRGRYNGLSLPNWKARKDEIATLTHSFENMVGELRDRDKIRGVLNKVVSKEISEEILSHNITLGGEMRTLTMLFSDIRGFTHLSEHLDPEALIGMLNDYMTRMCRVIDETHGVVDKFVGDEIMALYGAPVALENHAVKAIEAAERMLKQLAIFNEERRKIGLAPFEVGIGIHTGKVCAGNIGAENRLNYTVIGSNVNLAARLCGYAHAMQVLISEQTWQEAGVQEKFQFKRLDPIILKGIERPVLVYELLRSSP